MTDTAEGRTEVTALGPVDYLIVEFPGDKRTGEGLPILVDLVERGIIRVLDLEFIKKQADGSVVEILLADLDGDGELDLAIFEGASSGLLDADDFAQAADVLEPGSSAGILIYENTWARPFAAAMAGSGAQVVASGRIPLDELAGAVGDDDS